MIEICVIARSPSLKPPSYFGSTMALSRSRFSGTSRWQGLPLALGALGLAVSACGIDAGRNAALDEAISEARSLSLPTAAPLTPPASVRAYNLNFIADAAERVAPAVVQLEIETVTVAAIEELPPEIEESRPPLLKRFFG
ncbi:MAG: hypothetical protein AAFY15_13710, partial [Cyanobacteria bacterium J06648_11]